MHRYCQAKSPGVYALGSTSTSQLPVVSRMTASTPYGRSEGSWSCGYVSLAQCMATRIGTDMCVINPRYQASPQRERARQRVPG